MSWKTSFILIAAMADNRVIGREGKLPWENPEDLRNFRSLTTGGIVVMGRKTFESIGRPLPARRNIVLSRQSLDIPGVEIFASTEELIRKLPGEWIDKVFIIGGQKIYEEFLSQGLIGEVWLSRIPGDFEGDAFLAPFEEGFDEAERRDFETFEFIRYTKR